MRGHAVYQARARGQASLHDAAMHLEREALVDAPVRGMQDYHVPATGARATLRSAKALLFMYCQSLPGDR